MATGVVTIGNIASERKNPRPQNERLNSKARVTPKTSSTPTANTVKNRATDGFAHPAIFKENAHIIRQSNKLGRVDGANLPTVQTHPHGVQDWEHREQTDRLWQAP